jgi:transglutaminase-like putative cysteine protease/thiol-disulfide isomerase/thioredoxin
MITVATFRGPLRRLGVLVLLLAPALTLAAEPLQPWPGVPTPALRARTLDDTDLTLADFRGKTVIVNFWATWCVPCVAEMPALQRLRDRLAPAGVEVIAVNFQENATRIRPFVERMKLTFPVVRDHDGALRAAWHVNVFPTSFIIAPDQRIAWFATGEVDWDDPQVESRIRSLRPRNAPTTAFAPKRIPMDRRSFISAAATLPFATSWAGTALAETRPFAPGAAGWRTFEITTRLEIAGAGPGYRAWIPVPAVNTGWQESLASTWSGNMSAAALDADEVYGAKLVRANWADGETNPVIEVVSRIRTRDRAIDWTKKSPQSATPEELALALKSTEFIPTDGIVAATAKSVVAGKTTDVDKTRAIYEWVVGNTYREPTVRGCGVGDIKGMLETRNMGGKCADLNALFVGLCRASGIPARDIYGIRVAKSAFPYKELGAGSADISKAQHCRAEVYLTDFGWVAMDPADVAKVMRQETPMWIRDPKDEIAAPVYGALFGNWEGNWMGYNVAHDLALAGSKGPKVAFLMYPQAETRGERVDSLDPDTFKYKVTAREISG